MRRVQRGMTGRRLGVICLLLILLVAGFTLARNFQSSHEYGSEQFLMDTLVSIKVHGRDRELLKKAVTDAFFEMRRIAELADAFPAPGSPQYQGSDVCRINENAGKEPVRVDKDILAMLSMAKGYHEFSEGAFDVTVGPLMNLWGFGGKNPRLPAPERIRAALTKVGSQDLVLDHQAGTAFLRREGMKLDLGAVAKGYATEKALQVLKKHGIEKALIDAGGNIRLLGRNPHDNPWRIGVKDPRKSDGVVAVLPLEDTSAVTSADYYRGFEQEGKRYHHILDPRTGYPASHNMSVTVITKDAGVADILSTVLFVLPPEKALEMAAKLDGVELLVVTSDGRIRHTASLRGKVQVKPGGAYRYDQGR